jgi:sugar-specific transcriptional regulator TrmB
MEMPEGLKKLSEEANEVTSEFFDYSEEHLLMARQVETALELMKEMAEALEHIRLQELKKGTVAQYLEAWYPLKKFKEWK